MSRLFLTFGALAAGVAVVLGAFGAHGLEGEVSPDRLDTFRTGVQYQMYHALALLFVGWAVRDPAAWGPLLQWSGYCFIAGILIFSGTLYVLVLTDTDWLGAITPFGGILFIAGWALLAWTVLTGG